MVVAPIHCRVPLAREGFKIFAASTAPSAAPAPTMVCISSINKIQSGSFFNSSITFFNLSSNSPLYFVPATNDPISKVTNLLPIKVLGTVPKEILCASPSTIAVLPTPGSPIKTGLFFVLLLKI